MQNRHFVRPKVAVPFALHVNDEVAALTLPTWHQPGPFPHPERVPMRPSDMGTWESPVGPISEFLPPGTKLIHLPESFVSHEVSPLS